MMHAPQITMIVLLAIGLGLNIEAHGKPRTPTNVWHSIIGTGLTVGILWWGGFFAA